MCDTLSGLEAALRLYASAFEAETLSGEQADRVVRLTAAIEKVAGAIRTFAAARMATTGGGRDRGSDRRPPPWPR